MRPGRLAGSIGHGAAFCHSGRPYRAGGNLPHAAAAPGQVWPENQLRSWLLPQVYERLKAGQGEYLAELRMAVALFLRFSGLDYDQDDQAGIKLDAYIRWVQNILAYHEGNLIQLVTGDKGSYLYAAFGAPVAHGDDAARAIAAALKLQTQAAGAGIYHRNSDWVKPGPHAHRRLRQQQPAHLRRAGQ